MSRTLSLIFTVSVIHLLTPSSDTNAQVNFSVGIRGGLSSFEEPIGSGAQFGGHVSVKVAPNVDFEVMAELFSSTWEENQLETAWRNLLTGVTGRYNFSTPTGRVIPYIGAGMCLHRITKEFSSSVLGVTLPARQSSTEGCMHALGGVKFNLTSVPISIFVEGRYMAVGDEKTPDFPSLLGGFTLNILD